ncbi:hypothetical protein K445DRAFT_315860 [Daldinia sp. EC12]|nr:hypothetical protein K445DRAFT_315860 [Daldinia sp. EC12]
MAQISKPADRLTAYSNLGSVEDCIDAVPLPYRENIRQKFYLLSNSFDRYRRVNKTLQTLRTHKKNGTLPPQLKAISIPEFQFMKEFLEKEGENNPQATIGRLVQDFKSKALDTVIEAKEREIAFLGSLVNDQETIKSMTSEITRTYQEQLACHRNTNDSHMAGIETAPGIAGEPSHNNTDWLETDYKRALNDVPVLARRVIEIARSRDMADLQTSLAKLKIHQKAMPSQPEAAVTVKILNEYFDERLAEAVKLLQAKARPGKNAGSKKSDKKAPKETKATATGRVTKSQKDKRP